jgi:hypothetical protein
MADIFLSCASVDREAVRPVVDLLHAQGWSVWWDTRLDGGDRWDDTVRREIAAARCALVVWTPASIGREAVLEAADEARNRGILVAATIGAEPPPGFRRVPVRDLGGWDGAMPTAALDELLADVRRMLARNVQATEGREPRASPIRADVLEAVQSRIKAQDVRPSLGESAGGCLVAIVVSVGFVVSLAFVSAHMHPLLAFLVALFVLLPAIAAIVVNGRGSRRWRRIHDCLWEARLGAEEALALEQWIKTTPWRHLDRQELLDAMWMQRDLMNNPRVAEAIERAAIRRARTQRS